MSGAYHVCMTIYVSDRQTMVRYTINKISIVTQ